MEKRTPGWAGKSDEGLPLASGGRRQDLSVWNESEPAAASGDHGILELFERHASERPEAPALRFGEHELSYRQLDRRANRLARFLTRSGVGAEVHVGLCLERSPEAVISLLGILKAGGAYVPLDPSYPTERLAYMVEDSRAPLVLSSSDLASRLPETGGRRIFYDSCLPEISGESPLGLGLRIDQEQTAYVIYTSGSTGRPKGVLVPHRGLFNMAAVQADLSEVGPGSRVLQFASLSFDISVFEVLWALTSGAALHLVSGETSVPGPELQTLLMEEEITHIDLTPTALSALGALSEDHYPALREIISGGEACSAELVDRWAPGRRFFNAYGPTEATITATAGRCRAGDGKPSIGHPIRGYTMIAADRKLRPVSVGEIGELLIGGAGLARGYLGRPALTAERFVPDPWAAGAGGPAGSRLYRTGDLGRFLPDGRIDFQGRLDDQVKVRGYRIELGEIETAIREHPQVREVAVLAREDQPGVRRLVAYAVPATSDVEPENLRGDLRGLLRRRLPDYMVPDAFVLLDAMPLSPTGKLDRKALPRPESEAAEEYVAPRDGVEETLAGMWCELLAIDRVSATDDLFALGGHSLQMVQLIARIRQEWGVELSVRDIFEHPTVTALARAVEDSSGSSVAATPTIVVEPRQGPAPLTYPQERVWFLDRLSPGNIAYNTQTSIRFTGPLDVHALRRALTEVARRHEILRTSFPEVDGLPVQRVHPPLVIPLPIIDLRALDPARREEVAEDLVRVEVRRAFDLDRAPLARWSLMRLDEEDYLLLQTEHHFVHDGWALAVLLREIKELYGAFREGRPSTLPPPSLQYADFAVWHRKWLDSGVMAEQLAYWREQLADSPRLLELPTDRPRPKVQSFRGNALRVHFPAELYASLREFDRRQGVTLFTTMASTFYTLLHRYTGQRDILAGSGVANRRFRETETMLGMVVNTVVLRTHLDGEMRFDRLLEEVQDTVLESHNYQDMPFDKIVEEIQPDRDLSHNPLFQVMFSFHDSAIPPVDFSGLTGRMLELPNGSAKTDLNVIVIPRSEQRVGQGDDRTAREITLLWEYSTALFDCSTMVRMLGHYRTMLEALTHDPSVKLAELPLLGTAERHQLLAEWNDTAVAAPVGRVHELVAGWARRTPEALAAAGDEELTYGELHGRAERLGRLLRASGVGPESVVGVLLERAPRMLVAILATLEAGGAYLPLDPEAPRERLAFQLEDAGAGVLLTQERLLPGLPECRAKVIAIDAALPAIEGGSAEPGPAPRARAAQRAYVIYTSGSTGTPKGVDVHHAGLANLAAWHRRAYRLGPADRATQIAGLAFDASVWEVWPYLTAGASLHFPEPEVRAEPEKLVRWLAERRITHSFLPTPLAEAVLRETVLLEGLSPELELRTILTGGDKLQAPPPAGLTTVLVNHYGPTENTVVTTAGAVAPAEPGVGPESGVGPERAPDIGRPIDGVQVYILDRDLRQVPIGVAGELCIGGVAVARGYLGRPSLSAEVFVADPIGSAPGGRLYRSGDLARTLPDGCIEFLGRIDSQVKVRGFRIELGEIEAVLGGCEAVSECAVLAWREDSGDNRLVAYVTPSETAPESPEALRATIEELLAPKLPEYMIPAFYVVLDTLPLTANDKIDRRALPPPEGDQERHAARFVAPRTPEEDVVAAIWCEVLGRQRVSVEDDFFTLGGHSLLATRVMARLRQSFGVELPLQVLFEERTVAALATHVASRHRRRAGKAGLEPHAERSALPLSFGQERLWFLDRLYPGSAVYSIPAIIHLDGPLDAEALERGLKEIVRRHEILRTTYDASADGPMQVVHTTGFGDLRSVNLEAADEPRAEVDRLVREEAREPFDLERGPVFRCRLLRLGGRQHMLLVNLHHIAADGWSVEILMNELAALYQAATDGRPTPLPEPSNQYADFAAWQRRWLEDGALTEQVAYWRERLAGVEPLEIATDRPRPAILGTRGARESFSLPEELSVQVRELAQRHGATLYMVLLAAFQALLYRYTGQRDLTVASPIANRSRAETEGLIGFFINTLVLRCDLQGLDSDDPSFDQVLEAVITSALEAYAHQDVPFEKLVEELQPERRRDRNPLAEVSFVLQNASALEHRLDSGLSMRFQPVATGTAKFDLTLSLTDEDPLSGGVEYNLDLFDQATVLRLIGHYRKILEAAVAEPGRGIGELQLLTDREVEQLEAWNQTATSYPAESSIQELFEAHAARAPSAAALICGERRLSYAELDRWATREARRLRRHGVGPETLVGLYMERSIEMVVATLAILKAGGAYLPLDVNDPGERMRFVLEDSGIPLLITDDSLRQRLSIDDGGRRILRLEADDPDAETEMESAAPRTHPDQMAYVMYTSGSTGKPKGVVVRHRSVVRLVCDSGYARFGPDDVFLQFAPASFDAATFEIWGALLNGASLVIAPAGRLALEELCRVVAGQGVNVAFFTTALFHQLVDGDLDGLRDLRLLLTGGETVAPADARRALEQLPETTLVHCYGPTENTSFTTCDPMTDGAQIDHILPIGPPISNTTVQVLDRRRRPVPVGVPGELTTGGDGLARGYLRRPALTAERFVPDPTSRRPGERLYLTGDLARYRSDGRLEFLGRNDHQVKIRGFRIEPGEIEVALAAHPEVLECAVLVREDTSGEKMLVAHVATAGGVEPEELGAFLRRGLPEYMVPVVFDFLEALPMTSSGKVDRAVLGRRQLPDRAGGTELGPPRTPFEKLVAWVWSDVLDVSSVGRQHDFFQLGGHSLRATRVVARLQELLDVEVPLGMVFDAARLEDFTLRLDEHLGRSEAGERARSRLARLAADELPVDDWITRLRAAETETEIGRRDPSRPARLSFGQERLWFLDRLEPGSTVYTIPATIRFTGPLDVEALSQGLGEVVRRHEVLRSTYGVRAGESIQVIHAVAFSELEIVELGDRGEAEVERLLGEEIRRPFDLERGPVLRCRLLRLSGTEHVLVMNLHHIATDGWSMEVLMDELAALYQAAAAGQPSPLAELPVQYADFAAWQRDRFDDGQLAEQIAYWRESLADLDPLELATDHPRPAVLGTRGARQPYTLGAELSERVRQLAQQRGATLYMVLLAAFQALLHRYTGQADVAVGTPIANRGRAEVEGLIGFFVNTLVMRADFSADPSFEDHLGAVAETALAGYARQDVPFEKLVEELQPERRRDRNPLAEVSFVLQNAAILERQLGADLEMRFQMVHTGTSKFDLTLSVTDDEPLNGGVEYNTDLFDASTIDRLIGHYRTLLEGAVADPERPIDELPLLTAVEIERFATWNQTRTDYPRSSIQELFAEQAARTPDAIAASCGDRQLTYAQLGQRAGRLARRLRSLGIGPEMLVGLCVERSLEMVVATLAILEAGGAYVPLDPDFPEDRLRFMLADAAAPVVITHGALRSRLPIGDSPDEPRVIDLDSALEGSSDAGPEALLPRSHPDQLAYVMYTSGSTGRPKGVAVPHRGVVRLVRDTGYAHFGSGEVFPQFAPASFDAATFEIWGPLLNGGRLEVFAPGRTSLQALGRALTERRVSIMFITTALFHQMVEGHMGQLAGVRQLLTGGEVVAPADVRKVLEALPDNILVHCYGPTENTTFTTCEPMTDPSQVGHVLSLGGPIANTTVQVLDRHLRPVPVGVPGELLCGGDGLARCYLHRAARTATSFVPDPHCGADAAGARLYRTGDLVRYRPDGGLEFLGRFDHQVKIRGFRIELGEVEAVLGRHPRIEECVLAVWGKGPDQRLAAYVVAAGVEGRELREFLGSSLPDFMVPSSFTFLDRMPLTRTGKLNRRALPEPSAPSAASELIEPRSETEQQLAAIWRRWLKLDDVGVTDNFFELGGHSLLATQVIGDVLESFGVEVPLRVMFDSPTIEGLAIAVAAHEAERVDADAMEKMLDDLEGLADDELEVFLAQEDPTGG
ncbi:MAG: amino acid adenylation domain-containing protein [bacterium]|nr:amino acid adenylation domain-containing protein [bacterium]